MNEERDRESERYRKSEIERERENIDEGSESE